MKAPLDGVVAAYERLAAARVELDAAERRLAALLDPCPSMCPEGYQGHWRNWHKGHGCEADIRGNLIEYRRAVSAPVAPGSGGEKT
ncbi:MAG: hypothetical protein Q8P41_31870 [Pseudomonadota bacterium]|nr:hypothetical protein [Pseudomonadota bacterium]